MAGYEQSKGGAAAGRRLPLLRKLLGPLAIIAAWLLVTGAHVVRPLFVPGPGDLIKAWLGMRGELPAALVSSVSMTVLGFAIGTALGVLMGLTMAYSKIARELFGHILDFVRPVPVFALIPLFVLWFGIGRLPQIILIALGTSVVLGVTTLEAIKNVSPVHIKASLTLGANRAFVYRTVIVPSIVPHLLGAIRVAAAASWGLDVAAEFIGAQSGLGYLMITRQQYLDTAGIVLIVIIYSLLALAFDFALRAVQARLTRWTERDSKLGAVAAVVGNV